MTVEPQSSGGQAATNSSLGLVFADHSSQSPVHDFPEDDIDLISSPLTLPNGVVIPNRLVKAAMEEGITGGLPGKRHRRLYRRWGAGGWGIVITGNVAVDSTQLATAHDLRVYDNPHTVPLFTELNDALLADAPEEGRPLTLVQLSHAGIQSSPTWGLSRPPWEPAVAPVSARPTLGRGVVAWLFEHVLWPTKSRAVTDLAEWLDIAGKFIDAAAAMEEAGWDGVQLHSAHGYLLANYLSPLTNPHPRPLPGVPHYVPLHLHLLWLILTGIAAATEPRFVKAVKINSSDFVAGGMDEEQAADIIREIASWQLVDILEVSGGNYSNPAFAETAQTGSARQSLFAHFTTELIPTLPPAPEGPAILLTGGMHDRALISSSLRNRACDLAGIARPSALVPDLPRRVILNREIDSPKAKVGPYDIPQGPLVQRLLGGGEAKSPPNPGAVKLVGAGVSTTWHEWQMARIGLGLQPDPKLPWISGALTYTLWYDILGGGPRGWIARYCGLDE
ncbi:hypothetical protein Q8F55_007884 [Vanrija albida]|uniref:NADH:flavin oxidoreductase/NADH oxidase N-terminal domain-containing protein n=1 Tax=Vanrija albida TaxID=181172 RepID=A0ABR3PUR9_9TREE